MRIIPIRVHGAAYGVFSFGVSTPYWNYINIYGRCYDCNGIMMKEVDRPYAHVELEGTPREDGEKFGSIMSPFDLRTLEMVKAGCCPPGLVNPLLGEGPG